MNFPTTRYTLIHRLATGAAEEDWALFLADYWRPLCRFAARWGRLNLVDAEDIASLTLEVLIRNGLLERWVGDRRARLRTLLCGVVRRALANHSRKKMREGHHLREYIKEMSLLGRIDELCEESIPGDEADAFYQAWAEELLQSAVESLLDDYHREGRGDYFRVLFGRVCEGLPVKQIAEALSLKIDDVDNYFRHARSRLEHRLRELVRWHVVRYSGKEVGSEEFLHEWHRLGDFLERHGGLEEALRHSYADFDAESLREREVESMTAVMKNVREYLAERCAG
ncbi:MAG: RNA polymerase sigma factor [Planctomycetaceae bacterium]